MSNYAHIVAGVVAGIIESEVPQPGTVEAPEGATIGWLYDGEQFTAPAPQQVVEVVITGLAINGTQQINLARRVVISAGQSLGVTAQIRLGGQVLQITDSFAVPISRVRGDVDQTVDVQFINGAAAFIVQFPRSGEYAVLPEWLNMHLPADQQMAFEPFYISVKSNG